MSPAKKPSGTRSSAQKTTRKKTTAKKTAARRTAPKKAAAKGSASSKTTRSGRSPKATKTSARKATTKTPARSNGRGSGKVPAKSAGARKPAADKATDRKTTASKRSSRATAKTAREETPVAAPPKRRGKRPGLPPITMKKLAPKKASPARAAKFDKGEIDEIRRRLEAERAELEERIEEIEASVFEKTQSDLTGEAGFDEDFADAGTATFDRERELSIQNNVRDLIGQIDRAISRIDDGTYGTCERCGRPIDAPRLKALPHALLCMDCKRREERAR